MPEKERRRSSKVSKDGEGAAASSSEGKPKRIVKYIPKGAKSEGEKKEEGGGGGGGEKDAAKSTEKKPRSSRHKSSSSSKTPSKTHSSSSKTSSKPSSSSADKKDKGDKKDSKEKRKKRSKKSTSSSSAKEGGEKKSSSSNGKSSSDGFGKYRLKGVLGTGAFSTVREGYHRSNRAVKYAIKCVDRSKLSKEDEAALLDEVKILKDMDHKYIIKLYDFHESPETYYLVMERMCGGELFDRVVAKAYYNEKEARDTCLVILDAVGHMHSKNVAHRDLKPENLLLRSKDDDSDIKIADFGFAKIVKERNSLTTQCGTPGYIAPEILKGTPYDERADMWSVGVILYILLGGYPPFNDVDQKTLFRKIKRGEYEFHAEYWGTVSAEAKELIQSLLQVDVDKRLDAQQALRNTWITGDDTALAQKDLGVNLQEFRKFNAKRKFRAAVSTILAVNKLNTLGRVFFTEQL